MDWEEFRNNAAKDILCAMVSQCYDREKMEKQTKLAVEYANSLVRRLYLSKED